MVRWLAAKTDDVRWRRKVVPNPCQVETWWIGAIWNIGNHVPYRRAASMYGAEVQRRDRGRGRDSRGRLVTYWS